MLQDINPAHSVSIAFMIIISCQNLKLRLIGTIKINGCSTRIANRCSIIRLQKCKGSCETMAHHTVIDERTQVISRGIYHVICYLITKGRGRGWSCDSCCQTDAVGNRDGNTC